MPEIERPLSNLTLSYPPHIRDTLSVKKIMRFVALALMPANILAVYLYGLNALILLAASLATAIAAEAAFQFLTKKPVSVSDGSAVITGLLVAMNVPPEVPVWMPVTGSLFAIIIVKQLFGGLGSNLFNPALAAKALMIALWPAEMTVKKEIPAILTGLTGSGAGESLEQIYNLIFSKSLFEQVFICNAGCSLGEASVFLLLIGGVFLLFKRVITWRIPAAFIGTSALFMLLYYNITEFAYPISAAFYHIFSGSLFLGAFFMATDTATSPVTAKGMIIFGSGCGIITSIITLWRGYSEAVCYAILLMNAAVPFIDRYTKPRVFGRQGFSSFFLYQNKKRDDIIK